MTVVIRSTITYAAITLVSFLVALLAFEFWLRADDDHFRLYYYLNYDPPMYAPSATMPYTLRKNVSSIHFRRGEFETTIHTNSLGFREDREISQEKPKGTYRIVTIGDSFAFGYGVDRNKTFQAVAEERLKQRFPGRDVEVLDLGFVTAGSLDARYIYMRDAIDRLQPDAVIVTFFYGADLGRIIENRPYSTYDSGGLPLEAHYRPIEIDPDTGFRAGRYDLETQMAGRMFFPVAYPRPHLGEPIPTTPLDIALQNAMPNLFRGDVDGFCDDFRACRVIKKNWELRQLAGKAAGLMQHQLMLLPSRPQPVGNFLNDYPAQAEDGLPQASGTNRSVAREGWELAQKIFAGMAALAKDRKYKFGVVFVPSAILVDFDTKDDPQYALNRFYLADEMQRAVTIQKPDRLFGSWFKANRIAYLDPALPMRRDREQSGKKFYFPYDQHWNEFGSASLGRHVADWVTAQGWMQ